MLFYINGKFVPQEEANISILDLSVLRGYAVFDALRTYQGRPFHLRDHLLRLQLSATQLGLQLPHSLPEIETIIFELLKRNPYPESSIRILLTGGLSEDLFTPSQAHSFIAFNLPAPQYPEHYYTQGIQAITTSLPRPLAHIKTTQYAQAICALQQAKNLTPQEALYLNSRQEILEGTTSNFFAIKQGALITCCSDEILPGITRAIVLRLAKEVPLEKRALHYEEIAQIDEAFLTSSSRGIQPIRQIDTRPIGKGSVGPITRSLMEQFRAYTNLSQ